MPCCLRRLLSSPVEAVIRYRQPSGCSYHIQVEHRRAIAPRPPPSRCGMGERNRWTPNKLQTALKVCVTLMSNLSTSVRCGEHGERKKEKKRIEKNVDHMAEILVWIRLLTTHTDTHTHTHTHTPQWQENYKMISLFWSRSVEASGWQWF